jgi:NADH-quinone oxidoreductase subunit L
MYRRESLSPDTFSNLAGGFFYRVFDRKWYFDEFYQAVFVNGTLLLARFWSAFDAYIIDGIVNGAAALTRFVSWLNGLFDAYIIDGLVNAAANVTFWTGNKFRRLQTGNINGYLFVILLAMALAVYFKVHYWS